MSVDYTPQYPVAAEALTLTLSGAAGTTFAFELTATPAQSALTPGLLLVEQPVGSEVPISPLLAAGFKLLSSAFTPDVAGDYTFKAYDMREIVGTPAFSGDPSGENRFELLNTQSGIVKVGALMEMPVVTSDGNGATLQLRVIGDHIRAASFVDSVSEIGRVAALQPDVVQALAATVGKTIDAACTDLIPALKELREKYNGKPMASGPAYQNTQGHRSRAGGRVHFEADTVNVLTSGLPFSLKFAVKLVNDLREKLIGHLEDSIKYAVQTLAGPPAQFTGFWHYTGEQQLNEVAPVHAVTWGTPGADTTTTPILGAAIDLPTATVLLCELRWRVFNRHIRLGHGTDSNHPWLEKDTSSAPHVGFYPEVAFDEIKDVSESPVDTIIIKYLDTIVRMDPNFTPPSPEGAGMINMAHKYGFVIKS
jgi:hypothetical protein